MRAVTTATAAAVLGLKRKALDNILNRLDSALLPRGRQGVERRIPISVLADLFIATELSRSLGTPASRAFDIAQTLSSEGGAQAGPFVLLRVDRAAVQAELDAQLEVAIESVVRKPRGRPPAVRR